MTNFLKILLDKGNISPILCISNPTNKNVREAILSNALKNTGGLYIWLN